MNKTIWIVTLVLLMLVGSVTANGAVNRDVCNDNVIAEYYFNIPVDNVTISGNFSNDGYACIFELTSPNDGYMVHVNASENVILNFTEVIGGKIYVDVEGQIEYNFYAIGTTAVVRKGIFMWLPINDIPEPDPCEDITCNETICVGVDLYEEICVDGNCVPGEILESNCPECGYVVPDSCDGIICNETVCNGNTLYEEICVDGICVQGDLIESNCPECGYIEPDPCKDINCNETMCNGTNLYEVICVDGVCVQGDIIETNCPECGYVTSRVHRSGGGGSSGTYPPGWNTPTNTTNITQPDDMNTTVAEPDDSDPGVKDTPAPKPTQAPASEPDPTPTEDDTNPLPGIGGFGSILIVGLVGVLLWSMKKKG